MQFSISQTVLDEVISLVGRAVPKRPTHPILANILLEADKNTQTLTFTGFDLSMAIVNWCQADVGMGGKITIPAGLFSQIIGKLKGDLSFELGDNNTAKISCGKSSYSISVTPADEYPQLPMITGEERKVIKLNANVLTDGIKRTLFAAANDETKQILTGINLQLEPEVIRFVSTDGHRCAVYEVDRKKDSEDSLPLSEYLEVCDITIKNMGCIEMLKALAKVQDSVVTLAFNHSNLRLDVGKSSVICRKLEGQYPNAMQLFPKIFSTHIGLDFKSFKEALQRINVVADEKNSIVKCKLDRENSEILLTVDVPGQAGVEVIGAEIVSDISSDTEPLEMFAFNAKYLLAGLNVIETEKVQIGLNGKLKPIVLEDDQGMRCLIMPVQMRS